jgi:hypothetical protein
MIKWQWKSSYGPDILYQGTEKTCNTSEIFSPNQWLYLGFPEYETGLLNIWQQRSIGFFLLFYETYVTV